MKFIIKLICLLFLLIFSLAAKEGNKPVTSQKKPNGLPIATLLNINNFSAWYSANTKSEREPLTGSAGLTFPRGTAQAIYASGMMFGGILNDNGTQTLKVGGYSYNTGFARGAIIGIRTGVVENQNDDNVRIWRIRKDFATADLLQDASEYFGKQISSVTQSDLDAMRVQYKKDWQEWPAAKGAPFYDANNDGIYTPQFENVNGVDVPKLYPQADEPGLANADQVVWYVANDIAAGDSPWKSKPVGLEMQVTIWGYNKTGAMGNIAFKKFKYIFKGTASMTENAKIEDMYLTHWSDPDLGDAGDDFVGCDTILSLGYVYNAYANDGQYKKYNLAPPAIGYDFLQGPIVKGSNNDTAVFNLQLKPGYKNLPMTSFIYFAAGGTYSDPPFNANGAIQWYQMMRGLPPTPQGSFPPIPGTPGQIINPVTGLPTPFWLSGDPVTGTGWLDGMIDPPGDRRILQNSGPFTMALGDTQEIVVGVVGGVGNDRLESIVNMRSNDRFVQFSYNNIFKLIPPDISFSIQDLSSSDLKIQLNVKAVSSQYKSISVALKRQNGSTITNTQVFDDGSHNDGAANDGEYGNSITITKESTPASVAISVIDQTDRATTIEKAVEMLTIAGNISVPSSTIYYDNINNDGQVNKGELVRFGISFKNTTMFDLQNVVVRPLADFEDRPAITLQSINSGSTVNVNDANSYFAFRVPFDYASDHFTVPFVIIDSKRNSWTFNLDFPVVGDVPKQDTIPYLQTTNIVGNNDAQVGLLMLNPNYAGKEYDIWFGNNQSNASWTVVKPIDGTDYAAQHAELVPVSNAPNGHGYGTFTINDEKTSIAYSINVSGLSGKITSASVKKAGGIVKTLIFTNSNAQGTWTTTDANQPLTVNIVNDFIGGLLYIDVVTDAQPNENIRGQIQDGINKRQFIGNPIALDGTPNPFSSSESILDGYSLFVAAPFIGYKSVMQALPTQGSVYYNPNPEGTYSVGFNYTFLPGSYRPNESPITLEFNNNINYAMMYPPILNPTPGQVFPVQIPFAVFKDTTRVWPIIRNTKFLDSLWNTDSTTVYFLNGTQYKSFDVIAGIADTHGASNANISYYSSYFTAFPPTSNGQKGSILNAVNHILKGLYFLDLKNNGVAPPAGTKIVLSPSIAIKTEI